MSEEQGVSKPYIRWFKSVEREIAEEYGRLHAAALKDPQRAGHGGEQTWARILTDWLPPSYRVLTRKYIVPEVGDDLFETDVIVLHSSYPAPLHSREEVLSGGVAAAFSVKLTLDADGIRDGLKRAVALRRALHQRFGTAREEMLSPFPVGLLAHSHDWKAQGSVPRNNVVQHLRRLDEELVQHPRESLDFLCVADLGFWWTMRAPLILMPSQPPHPLLGMNPILPPSAMAFTSIGETELDEGYTPVASLLTHLLARLSYIDPTLKPLASSLRFTGALGTTHGPARQWPIDSVFSEIVRRQLPHELFKQGSDFWGAAFF
jgi:hypothetical protein